MSLARKLLIPALALFALGFLGLVVYSTLTTRQVQLANEQRALESMKQALDEELQGYSNLSLALAKQTASNPQVQEAFAAGDRQRLAELTLPSYLETRNLYNLSEEQFSIQPAQVFLRLSDPSRYGEDLSASRLSLVAANQQHRDVSGLEIAADGLGMRGIAPIDLQERKGSVEVSIQVGRQMLNDLKQEYEGEWQLYLRRGPMRAAGYPGEPGSRTSPQADLVLQASTLDEPLFATPEVYQRVLLGQTVTTNLSDSVFAGSQERHYAIMTIPLRDFSGQVIGAVDALVDDTDTRQALLGRLALTSLIALGGWAVGGSILTWMVRRSVRPVSQLTQATQAITAGKFSRRAPVRPGVDAASATDEIDLLALNFNAMAEQLERLVTNLEERVAERTANLEKRSAQLQVAAEIAREVTSLAAGADMAATFIDELLDKAVDLIRHRFDFYHAGVFLIEGGPLTGSEDTSSDRRLAYAVLHAATGEAGQRMLEAGHRLRVGQAGLVGAACSTGRPHIALDVEHDVHHIKNPFLPETRSEIALPLRSGTTVIGALDVQSQQTNAFDESDMTVLQILADQLAIAINNARLLQGLRQTVSDLEQVSGKIIWKNWHEFAHHKARSNGYLWQRGSQLAESAQSGQIPLSVLPELDDYPAAQHALNAGETLLLPFGAHSAMPYEPQAPDSAVLAVPIKLRGQTIGVIHMRFETSSIPPATVDLVEEFSNRLGLVLESSRLLYEAQRLATREQQINWIVSQVRGSVELETILRDTVRELGRALGARRTTIQVGDFSEEMVDKGGGAVESAGTRTNPAQKPPTQATITASTADKGNGTKPGPAGSKGTIEESAL